MMKMSHNRVTITLLALSLALATTTGCTTKQMLATVGIGAAVGAGAAGVMYAKGDLEAEFDQDLKTVYKAADRTVRQRDYSVKESKLDSDKALVHAEIPGKDDNERTLKINLKKDGDKTHISIRVGIFGDEALSKSILDDIENNLK